MSIPGSLFPFDSFSTIPRTTPQEGKARFDAEKWARQNRGWLKANNLRIDFQLLGNKANPDYIPLTSAKDVYSFAQGKKVAQKKKKVQTKKILDEPLNLFAPVSVKSLSVETEIQFLPTPSQSRKGSTDDIDNTNDNTCKAPSIIPSISISPSSPQTMSQEPEPTTSSFNFRTLRPVKKASVNRLPENSDNTAKSVSANPFKASIVSKTKSEIPKKAENKEEQVKKALMKLSVWNGNKTEIKDFSDKDLNSPLIVQTRGQKRKVDKDNNLNKDEKRRKKRK